MKKSQIMTKLNPMKSPNVPPQSATRELKGKASCSLSMSRVGDPNMIFSVVMFSCSIDFLPEYFVSSITLGKSRGIEGGKNNKKYLLVETFIKGLTPPTPRLSGKNRSNIFRSQDYQSMGGHFHSTKRYFCYLWPSLTTLSFFLLKVSNNFFTW